MRFVLLVPGPAVDEVSPASVGRRIEAMVAWAGSLRDRKILLDGGPLVDGSVSVRIAGTGLVRLTVPSGVLAKVRSWYLIDASDLERAIEIARSCPEAKHLEVPVLAADES